MSTQDDGGLAFPCGSGDTRDPSGMSLRDYAAIKFAAAWVIVLGTREYASESDAEKMIEANRRGLKQADAMLIARKA